MNFDPKNIWLHAASSAIGALILLGLFAVVWPLKLATFDQVSPVMLVVVPFLLYGKKPVGAGGE